MQDFWMQKPETYIYIDFSLEVSPWMSVAEGNMTIALKQANLNLVWLQKENIKLHKNVLAMQENRP